MITEFTDKRSEEEFICIGLFGKKESFVKPPRFWKTYLTKRPEKMHMNIALMLVAMILLVACTQPITTPTEAQDIPQEETPMPQNTTQLATFAGGCFWCMEPPFENTKGVISVTSGYAGGEEVAPTYEQVSSGETGHREAVQVIYDPQKVTYKELLDVYWRQIDPTDAQGSFVDRGFQYTSAIFYQTEEEKALAEESKQAVEERFGKPVAVKIVAFSTFYPAEEYHQDYSKKNPLRYKFYRGQSGRDDYIQENWYKDNSSLFPDRNKEQTEAKYVKPSDEEIKKMLTPLQYEVTQEEGTEQAFKNEYWDNHEPGIYVDIVTGEPLFSSLDKYDSKTGWPSFSKPLSPENIVEKKDYKLFLPRTEVRSKHGDSHLGHVFTDGPKEDGGLRYCMNSAALRFIPLADLEKEGYGEYAMLFDSPTE